MSIESVMPSNHFILCRPLLLLPSIPPSIRVFSNESALHIRWPKYWSFTLGWTGWISLLSHVQFFATPWTVALQAPLSMGFSRQEYWSGLPFPSPGDLPDPGIKPRSSALQAEFLPSEPSGKPHLALIPP